MTERDRSFRAPLTDDELRMLRALAEHAGVPQSVYVRQFIRAQYVETFGRKKPAPLKKKRGAK